MKKQFLLLFAIVLSLSSCSRYKNTIESFDLDSYNKDVVKYQNVDKFNTIDEMDKFKVNTYLVNDENKFIYTIQIVYKDFYLSNLKAIMIPSNYQNNNNNNILPCIGYSSRLNLAKEKNAEQGDYSGYNLSYKTTLKNEIFYLYISYTNEENKELVYQVDSFTQL